MGSKRRRLEPRLVIAGDIDQVEYDFDYVQYRFTANGSLAVADLPQTAMCIHPRQGVTGTFSEEQVWIEGTEKVGPYSPSACWVLYDTVLWFSRYGSSTKVVFRFEYFEPVSEQPVRTSFIPDLPFYIEGTEPVRRATTAWSLQLSEGKCCVFKAVYYFDYIDESPKSYARGSTWIEGTDQVVFFYDYQGSFTGEVFAFEWHVTQQIDATEAWDGKDLVHKNLQAQEPLFLTMISMKHMPDEKGQKAKESRNECSCVYDKQHEFK